MLKKVTSLLIIALMLGVNAAPLLAQNQKSCCESNSCCMMKNSREMQCDMEMRQCESHIFFTVLTAPLVKQEHKVQLTITPVPQLVISAPITQWIDIPRVHEADSGPDIFRTLPLII